MMKKGFKAAALALLAGFLFAAPGFALDADPAAQRHLDRLTAALISGDLEASVEDATDDFRKGMTPEVFEGAHASFAEFAKEGYTATYLGELDKQGYRLFLWKLSFPKEDDILAKLVLSGDKVAGFWLE